MIQCTCSKGNASSRRLCKIREGFKSCTSCGGIISGSYEPKMAGTMLSAIELGLSSGLDPQLNWKTPTKGKQRAVRRARTSFTEVNHIDSYLKGSKDSDDSFDDDSKRKGDALESESEKLGVCVLGQHFSNTQKFFPIKKRRQMLFGSSSPLHQSFQFEDSSRIGMEKLGNGIDVRHDQNHQMAAEESIKLNELNEKLPEVADFSGIAILATVACKSNVGGDLLKAEEFVWSVNGPDEANMSRKPDFKTVTTDPMHDHVLHASEFLQDIAGVSQRSSGAPVVPGNVLDRVEVGSLQNQAKKLGMVAEKNAMNENISFQRDRLHWDLNTPMDAWESPCDVDNNADSCNSLESSLIIQVGEHVAVQPCSRKDDLPVGKLGGIEEDAGISSISYSKQEMGQNAPQVQSVHLDFSINPGTEYCPVPCTTSLVPDKLTGLYSCEVRKEKDQENSENFHHKMANADLISSVQLVRSDSGLAGGSLPPNCADIGGEKAESCHTGVFASSESETRTSDSVLCDYDSSRAIDQKDIIGASHEGNEYAGSIDVLPICTGGCHGESEEAHVQNVQAVEFEIAKAEKADKSSTNNHFDVGNFEAPVDRICSGSYISSHCRLGDTSPIVDCNTGIEDSLHESKIAEATPMRVDTEEFDPQDVIGSTASNGNSDDMTRNVDLLRVDGDHALEKRSKSFHDHYDIGLRRHSSANDFVHHVGKTIEFDKFDFSSDDDSQYEDGEVRHCNMKGCDAEIVRQGVEGEIVGLDSQGCFDGSISDFDEIAQVSRKYSEEAFSMTPVKVSSLTDNSDAVSGKASTERVLKGAVDGLIYTEDRTIMLEGAINDTLALKASRTQRMSDPFIDEDVYSLDLRTSSMMKPLASDQLLEGGRIFGEGAANMNEVAPPLDRSGMGETSRNMTGSSPVGESPKPRRSSVTLHRESFENAKRRDGNFRGGYSIDRNSRNGASFCMRGGSSRRGDGLSGSDNHWGANRHSRGYYQPTSFMRSGSRNALEENTAKLKSSGFVVAPDGTILKAGSASQGTRRPISPFSQRKSSSFPSRGLHIESEDTFGFLPRNGSVEDMSPTRLRSARYDGHPMVRPPFRRRDQRFMPDIDSPSSIRRLPSRRDPSFSPPRRQFCSPRPLAESHSRSRTRSPHFWKSPRESRPGPDEGPCRPHHSKYTGFRSDARLERSRTPNRRPHSELTADYAPVSGQRLTFASRSDTDQKEHKLPSSNYHDRDHYGEPRMNELSL